jgi:C-terminal processing protease CtpA/Prc
MYYLPDGSTIHESGIIPHVTVPCDEEIEGKLRIQRFQDAFSDPEGFEKLFGFAPVRDKQFQIGLSLFSDRSIAEIQEQVESEELAEDTP